MVINMNIDTNTSKTATSTSTTYSTYCPHRLPCGYCRLLYTDCPKGYYGFTYTTNSGSNIHATCVNHTKASCGDVN